jgi:hypothetical protein
VIGEPINLAVAENQRRAIWIAVAMFMAIAASACAAEENPGDSDLEELADLFERSPSCTEDCGPGQLDLANIVTLDGLAYEMPTAGDYVLVLAEDRSVAVQVRFAEGDSAALAVTNVAAVLTDYPVEVDATGALRIDGRIEDLPSGSFIPLIDGAAIFRDGDVYSLAWPGEGDARFRLDVTMTGDALRLTSYLPPVLAGSVGGLIGNGDGISSNDLTTRSGTTLEGDLSSDALIHFVQSWSVDSEETLFGCEPDEYSSKNDLDNFELGC